jgi:hypothetical protein
MTIAKLTIGHDDCRTSIVMFDVGLQIAVQSTIRNQQSVAIFNLQSSIVNDRLGIDQGHPAAVRHPWKGAGEREARSAPSSAGPAPLPASETSDLCGQQCRFERFG